MQLDYNLFAEEVENKLPMNNRRLIKEVKDERNEKSHRKKVPKYKYLNLKIFICFYNKIMKFPLGRLTLQRVNEIKI